MIMFLSAVMVALLVWMVLCEMKQERKIPKISFNKAIRAVWVRELERDDEIRAKRP